MNADERGFLKLFYIYLRPSAFICGKKYI